MIYLFPSTTSTGLEMDTSATIFELSFLFFPVPAICICTLCNLAAATPALPILSIRFLMFPSRCLSGRQLKIWFLIFLFFCHTRSIEATNHPKHLPLFACLAILPTALPCYKLMCWAEKEIFFYWALQSWEQNSSEQKVRPGCRQAENQAVSTQRQEHFQHSDRWVTNTILFWYNSPTPP